jgi:hypothetical protein
MGFSPPGDRRRWALGGAAIAILAVAGLALLTLGDGELSRAEFAAQANAACAEANEAFEELQEEPPRTAREALALTEELIRVAEDEHDAIDGLRQPSALDEPVERYLEAREGAVELLREGREAAEAGDSRRYQEAQEELTAGQGERRRLARRIGLRECSRPIDSG